MDIPYFFIVIMITIALHLYIPAIVVKNEKQKYILLVTCYLICIGLLGEYLFFTWSIPVEPLKILSLVIKVITSVLLIIVYTAIFKVRVELIEPD